MPIAGKGYDPPATRQVREEDIVSQQKSVTSKDGTPIAYWHSGQGPPLVLVHGTAADHGRCAPVLPTFEQHFSVCAVDRRGRGASGDSEDYAIEREFEDIAAVVDSLGEPPILLGHSYGALCALEAVLLTRNVRKSVLCELGFEMAGQEPFPPSDIERLEALLGAGDRERVVATFMREVAGLPPETVEHMRSQPTWQVLVSAAHTIPRELRAGKAYMVRCGTVRGSRGADAGAERRREPGCS